MFLVAFNGLLVFSNGGAPLARLEEWIGSIRIAVCSQVPKYAGTMMTVVTRHDDCLAHLQVRTTSLAWIPNTSRALDSLGCQLSTGLEGTPIRPILIHQPQILLPLLLPSDVSSNPRPHPQNGQTARQSCSLKAFGTLEAGRILLSIRQQRRRVHPGPFRVRA
uniref:Secreted protein n=1 Tax=Ixodes ricinus TaxID=34613 RepID=A0A6B0UXV6_IXORI